MLRHEPPSHDLAAGRHGHRVAIHRRRAAEVDAVIGYLHARSRDEAAAYLAAFRQGLAETGYVEGQNIAIEYRWADGHYDRSPALAADLASRKLDAIVAIGPPSAHAIKSATSTIPIVFLSGDPVTEGLVASLARPGGNLTGFSVLAVDLAPKQLELLSELAPQAGPATGRMRR